MFLLPGHSALSTPRFQALQEQLFAISETLKLRHAVYFYAIEASEPVDLDRLARLLTPGTAEVDSQWLIAEPCRIVVPRLGTLSP